MHSNAVDIAVLEWCKLFGGRNENYSWRRVVSHSDRFEQGLLVHLASNRTELRRYIDQMKFHRDKYVAHLDDENDMFIPDFSIAWSATQFYFSYVTEVELVGVTVVGEAEPTLVDYYDAHFSEATDVYRELCGERPAS